MLNFVTLFHWGLIKASILIIDPSPISFFPFIPALKVGDKFLVNGRWSIALKKDIQAAGTKIKYRLGKGPGSVEILTAAGPITKELQIVVCRLHFSQITNFIIPFAIGKSNYLHLN